jgi:hypothetical protein
MKTKKESEMQDNDGRWKSSNRLIRLEKRYKVRTAKGTASHPEH